MAKTSKQLERHFKGVANHWRIDILFLISQSTRISLGDITLYLRGNTKTIAEHTRKLYVAGLITKKYYGNMVLHELSPYGKKMISLLKAFSYSAEFENALVKKK